jgi:hypothetical protein
MFGKKYHDPIEIFYEPTHRLRTTALEDKENKEFKTNIFLILFRDLIDKTLLRSICGLYYPITVIECV